MNDKVRAYADLVESIAVELSRSRRAASVGAEYDDLMQEGLIAVWIALESGVETVGPQHIRFRMLNYMRWLGRHGNEDYEQMLPFDDELDTQRRSGLSKREAAGRTNLGKDSEDGSLRTEYLRGA